MYAGTFASSPGGTFQAQVLADQKPLALWRRWDGRRFVAGVPGQEYRLRVVNCSHRRISVVAAIDHQSVLERKTADPQAGTGMIIAAHSAVIFDGWRIDDSTTQPFVFAAPEQSVAKQVAGPQAQTGVIGFAAFRERAAYVAQKAAAHFDPDPFPLYRSGATMDMATYSTNTSASRSAASKSYLRAEPAATSASFDLGTGIGEEQQHSPVTRARFDREDGEPDILGIWYATEDALREMGLMRPADPEPFAKPTTGYEALEPARF